MISLRKFQAFVFCGERFDFAETEKRRVHAISVLPMPDTRQAPKNAAPNQSDGNVEGSTFSLMQPILECDHLMLAGFFV